jgi:hypothetical protein
MLICINFAFERIHYERYHQGGTQIIVVGCSLVGAGILPYHEAQMQGLPNLWQENEFRQTGIRFTHP